MALGTPSGPFGDMVLLVDVQMIYELSEKEKLSWQSNFELLE
jgi:hypothetical protein